MSVDDFDRELELENAGIDAFAFSIMDEDERREVLEDAGLDYADYEYFDLDTSFSCWSDLQDAGLSLHELQAMDEEEQREVLESADLFPEDYGIQSPDFTYAMKRPQIRESRTVFNAQVTSNPSSPIKQESVPNRIYRYCSVQFPYSNQICFYRADGFQLSAGDVVEVPARYSDNPQLAKVIAVRDFPENEVPCPVALTKSILGKSEKPFPVVEEAPQEKHTVFQAEANTKSTSLSEMPDGVSVSDTAKQQRQAELRRINSSMRIIRYAAVVLILLAVVVVYVGIQDSKHRTAEQYNYIFIPSPSDPVLHSTSTPVSTPSYLYDGISSAPYIGEKLSRYDDELYFLGDGGKIGSVSTSKFRYSVGSKTYVVYLDNDYVIKKIEDYLPNSSSKSSSSGRGKTSDPYRAKDYSHPDDFYYDHYDDFWDYEDAEDYWEEYS